MSSKLLLKDMRKLIFFAAIASALAFMASGQSRTPEMEVIDTVKRFYADFEGGALARADEYTTEDWNHINPFGGRTVGGGSAGRGAGGALHFSQRSDGYAGIHRCEIRRLKTAVVVFPSRISTFISPAGLDM